MSTLALDNASMTDWHRKLPADIRAVISIVTSKDPAILGLAEALSSAETDEILPILKENSGLVGDLPEIQQLRLLSWLTVRMENTDPYSFYLLLGVTEDGPVTDARLSRIAVHFLALIQCILNCLRLRREQTPKEELEGSPDTSDAISEIRRLEQ